MRPTKPLRTALLLLTILAILGSYGGGGGARVASAEVGNDVIHETPPDPSKPVLDRKLPEVRFDNVGFADVIDFFRDVTGANVSVNWRALEGVKVDRNAPITLRLRDVKFSTVLDQLADQVADAGVVGWELRDNVITITTAKSLGGKLVEKTYDVRFLAKWRPPTTQPTTKPVDAMYPLVRILYGSIAPPSWKVHGGTAEIKDADGLLVITATEENHRAIANLIENLKQMNGEKN